MGDLSSVFCVDFVAVEPHMRGVVMIAIRSERSSQVTCRLDSEIGLVRVSVRVIVMRVLVTRSLQDAREKPVNC